MTACNVILRGDTATIITDSRVRGSTGEIYDIGKAVAIPHMRLAFCARGKLAASAVLHRMIAVNAHDYDSTRAYLQENFKALAELHYRDEAEQDAFKSDVEVFVVGQSSKGPAAFVISSANTGWQVQDIPYVSITPAVSQDLLERFGEDPQGCLLELMNAQGRATADVGGYINVTQVGPAVIESYTAAAIGAANGVRAERVVGLVEVG